jgi:putative transposase
MKSGSQNQKQFSLSKINSQHRFSHGGELRKKRRGRKIRSLSTKNSVHVVFKVNKYRLRSKSLRTPQAFQLVQKIIRHYAIRFHVKVEQISIQNDHCHLLIRTARRSLFHHFFRVTAGQIAQNFENQGLLLPNKILKPKITRSAVTGAQKSNRTDENLLRSRGTQLWLYRPFSRVVLGWRAYKIVRDYIQLNEKEIRGEIPYRSSRLKGLTAAEWARLWS